MIPVWRAVLALIVFLAVPPSLMLLARFGRWPGALTLGALFVGYVVVEVVDWLLRERRRRRQRWARLRSAGRPLADVTYSREGWWG